MAVVIYHETLGVYIGELFGLGFWSKVDDGGVDRAVVFDDAADAIDYLNDWSEGPQPDCVFVEVVPDLGKYASVLACIRAGLPGWIPRTEGGIQ